MDKETKQLKWTLGEPGGEAVRKMHTEFHIDCEENILTQLDRFKHIATLLALPIEDCESAMNLAECLRLSKFHHNQSVPSSLFGFVDPILYYDRKPWKAGKLGTHFLYNEREMLVLLALSFHVKNVAYASRLFCRVSSRSEDGIRSKLREMQNILSEKEGIAIHAVDNEKEKMVK